MNVIVIDLNADVGERPGSAGVRADAAILAGVSSANVACGFHAGDGATMHELCELAMLYRTRIGAHVSYLDPEGFGRRDLDVDPDTLREHVVQQIESLKITAGAVGAVVTYVKPHGALYNRAAIDRVSADTIASATAFVDAGLKLLGPPNSELLAAAARHGLEGVPEGFADRAYQPDGTLVPRDETGALLNSEQALVQARLIAIDGHVIATDGSSIPLRARSLCIHSDTPGAAELAVALRNHLIGAGAEVRPFT
jgi:UPF0271 protein